MENQIQLAVKAFSEAKKPNIAQLAREFDVPYHRLRARSHGRQSYADRAETTRTLNLIQEKALTSWVQTLDSAHISSTPEIVEDAANAILKKAGENRVVGHNWAYRFLARLPLRLNYIKQKPKEKSRVESEDYGALLLWFNHLSRVVNQHPYRIRFIIGTKPATELAKGSIRLLPLVQLAISLPVVSQNQLLVLNALLPMAG